MIIDFHTHIFPPQIREQREEYLRRDPTFAEMYASPQAKIATADDLLRSMEESAIDVSVALGFAWREHELCQEHNDYLLEAAARSGGRIVPFCTVNMADARAEREVERCSQAGSRGLGELRPESQGWDISGASGEQLAALAQRHNLILLFHVTEPVGHEYAGKAGLRLESFYRFLVDHPGLQVVGAHLAGGLPFFASMPEVRGAFTSLYMDTAAQPLLYEPAVYPHLLRLIGPQRLLLGSDYPLFPQGRLLQEIESIAPDNEARHLILGGNAQRLMGLKDHGRPR